MKSKRSNWLKQLLQWGTLVAIVAFILSGVYFAATPADVEAYCPFGGLQALGSYLVNNSLACSMSMVQIMMGVMLAVGVILFSKLFCGYLCPLGTVGEWLGKMGKKFKMNVTIASGSVTDRALRIIKYGLLFWIFYMSVSSSELFCKNFDPYYALATGFKGEITVWMTCISIIIMFLGSIFIKMFWCKYICPLGALSNIFKFTFLFLGVLIIIWIGGMLGLANAWVWGLGIACLAAYIIEMTSMKSCAFPLLKIVRDENSCTSCQLCTKKCPYNIPVHKLKSVKHVDCTMCGDCISSCKDNSLTVNNKKSWRWLPGIIVVLLFTLALILGQKWELPTIDEKWGDYEKIENLETFEMNGLTSVKCFGSSKAFSAKMQKVPGVYGVKTFVKRFNVVILFDPAVTNMETIQKAIFTPTQMKFESPLHQVDSVDVITMGVEGLFDKMDMVYFGNILRNMEGVYGFDAEFACPVVVRVYVDPNAELTEDIFSDSIQIKETMMPVHGGGYKIQPINYKLKGYVRDGSKVSRTDFLNEMFKGTKALSGIFKINQEKYSGDEFAKSVYEIEYAPIEKPLYKRGFPFFKSFLSTQDGLMSIDVELKDATPVLRLTYVSSMWDDARIWKELFNAPVWTIKYSDGTTKDEEPKLLFETEGKTIEPTK